ncbi:hypothetical protein ACF09H_42005 [Streptomyces sp. NPDC014983]|uniref:hypothetical protein n=1 Tax=Streptomyces sp. NPDC014983 TaxID=3364933 RepID=UPI0036FD1FEF
MHALSRFGELAWFKLPAEYNEAFDYYQVPYMGWRYKSPPEGVAEVIEGAVTDLPTQLQWMLDKTRRNWVLLPRRIYQEAHGLADPGFSDTVHTINSNDQGFCLKALSDLDLIIQRLNQIPVSKD